MYNQVADNYNLTTNSSSTTNCNVNTSSPYYQLQETVQSVSSEDMLIFHVCSTYINWWTQESSFKDHIFKQQNTIIYAWFIRSRHCSRTDHDSDTRSVHWRGRPEDRHLTSVCRSVPADVLHAVHHHVQRTDRDHLRHQVHRRIVRRIKVLLYGVLHVSGRCIRQRE